MECGESHAEKKMYRYKGLLQEKKKDLKSTNQVSSIIM